MIKPTLIKPSQISELIKSLNQQSNRTSNHWKLITKNNSDDFQEQFLQADYKFKTFNHTWKFLNQVASEAHKSKHHPTITTTYNRVEIKLTTHDEGNKITVKDLELAQSIHKSFNQATKDLTREAP